MTDNTQEIDEVLFSLTDLSYASFTTQEEANRVADQLDYDRAEAKQALLDWHNKRTLELLDRLESMAAYDPSGMSPVINPREVEAERNKLKENTDE